MTDQPEKLELSSMDLTEEKKQELLSLFPEIRTEDGKIDFDRLKLVLGETVDTGKERYGMNWPGKAECFRTIQAPSTGTLLPCSDESVNFETTENLIIDGDNLEVLKLMQKSYLGKIKMIYIDPPYNTGNDFIYPDNFSESMQTYLEYTGQVDDSYINLYWYGSRWYDPALGRFIQPDTIVPSMGEGGNPDAVGYVANANYSPLAVAYHETQFLEQLNQENRARLDDPNIRLPGVPTNPLAFDRYAYTFNNSIRYNDPTGHCPFCIVIVIGGAAVTIGVAEMILIGGAVILAVDAITPGAQERHEAFAHSMVDLGEQASNGIQTLLHKGEYIPPGMSQEERNAYREALHQHYKNKHGLGSLDNVPKSILDQIRDKIKGGKSPWQAANEADAPPEADDEGYQGRGGRRR